MVYDDYADIGIFAKRVMDAPGIGERAHSSEGRRCPCTRKGIKLVLLTIIAISQPVFVWTFQIRKRLRISLPKFVEETFYPYVSNFFRQIYRPIRCVERQGRKELSALYSSWLF